MRCGPKPSRSVGLVHIFLGHFSNLYTGMTSADLLLSQLLRLLEILCAVLEQLCFIFLEVF